MRGSSRNRIKRECWVVKTMIYLRFVMLPGLLLAAAPPNQANGAADCARLGALVAFVAERSGYPPLRNCPDVKVASAAALIAVIAPEALAQGEEPRAAYVVARDEILLAANVALATPLGRSYLVHELVHVHQFEEGAQVRAPCAGWLEGEAYRVQASYLRTHGLDKDAFAFELLGLLQGACAQFYNY